VWYLRWTNWHWDSSPRVVLFTPVSIIPPLLFTHHLLRVVHNRRKKMGDSSVGIATRYRLDVPGIESRWEAGFSAPVQTGPGAHPTSYIMGTGSFPGGVALTTHSLPSSAEVEGRVELYICSHSGPSWPVLGRVLPLPLPGALRTASANGKYWTEQYFNPCPANVDNMASSYQS
jgi:hypothetical protein